MIVLLGKNPVRLRKKVWNERAYLKVATLAPFSSLFDPWSQEANGWPVPQKIATHQCGLDQGEWEEYQGPVHPRDK